MEYKQLSTPKSTAWCLRLIFYAAVCLFLMAFYAEYPKISSSYRTDWNVANAQHRYSTYDQVYQFRDPLDTEIGHPTLDPSLEHLHYGSRAMVASDVPLCSIMGKDILLRGGNAADAAVTVALCIGSVNLHSSGLGGGGFILSLQKGNTENEIISIDGREKAPSSASKSMFSKTPLLLIIGGLAVGVPGELKALDELFRRHGSGNLTWLQLISPVISLNRLGFNCLSVLANAIKIEDELILQQFDSLRENFGFLYKPNGSVVLSGDLISRQNLAKTLSIIAKNGLSNVFYDPNGPIAPLLAQKSRQYGGILTAQDFAEYLVRVEEPLVTNFTAKNGKHFSVYTTRGVSLGLALIAGIQFFTKMYSIKDSATLTLHKLIESFRWLASVRLRLGDYGGPGRFSKLADNFKDALWVQEKIEQKRYSDFRTFEWHNYEPEYQVQESRGTAHLSIVDEHNNAVSMTTTVNLLFGSLVLEPVTGIILNNQMDDFSLPHTCNSFGLAPSKYNYICGSKRPLLSAVPVIITDDVTGLPDMVIGAAGGLRITTSILSVLVRSYLFDLDLLHAVAAPRIHDQLIPMQALVEDLEMLDSEFGDSVTADLIAIGHNLTSSGPCTSLNTVQRINSTALYGVSDYWRKLGEAEGY